jgi:Flp pilus assembly protein TadG
MKSPRIRATACSQRGAYAVEFALVFLIFFAVLYGIICYGMLFAFRLGLQNAAEDGARAALRYQVGLPARAAKARAVAIAQASWLPTVVTLDVTATVCQVANNNCSATIISACGITWDARCQMIVTVTAGSMRQLLPPLPVFTMPDQLTGRATMLLDGRTP